MKNLRLDEIEPISETSSDDSEVDEFSAGEELTHNPGTSEFKQERKRKQNRESASRYRNKKQRELHIAKRKLNTMIQVKQHLVEENLRLVKENEALKKENELFKSKFK